jgi:hypothetical protein
LVFEQSSNNNLLNVSVSELENGYYFAILKTQNGVVTHKIMIQH